MSATALRQQYGQQQSAFPPSGSSRSLNALRMDPLDRMEPSQGINKDRSSMPIGTGGNERYSDGMTSVQFYSFDDDNDLICSIDRLHLSLQSMNNRNVVNNVQANARIAWSRSISHRSILMDSESGDLLSHCGRLSTASIPHLQLRVT